jgi:hypothetical protein
MKLSKIHASSPSEAQIEELVKIAEAGNQEANIDAQYRLSQIYRTDRTLKAPLEALYWMKKARENKHPNIKDHTIIHFANNSAEELDSTKPLEAFTLRREAALLEQKQEKRLRTVTRALNRFKLHPNDSFKLAAKFTAIHIIATLKINPSEISGLQQIITDAIIDINPNRWYSIVHKPNPLAELTYSTKYDEALLNAVKTAIIALPKQLIETLIKQNIRAVASSKHITPGAPSLNSKSSPTANIPSCDLSPSQNAQPGKPPVPEPLAPRKEQRLFSPTRPEKYSERKKREFQEYPKTKPLTLAAFQKQDLQR